MYHYYQINLHFNDLLIDWFNDWFVFERFMKYMVYLLPMMWVIMQIQANWNDRQHEWHKTNGSSEQSAKRGTLLYPSLQASEVTALVRHRILHC